MTSDGLKNLQISYNFLNLPSVVAQDDTPVAEYSWFADGSKFSIITPEGDGYYYTGSLIYASNNGNLQIESTDFAGGRINLVENTSTNALSQDIQYHHKDHLGSVRAITDNSGSVIEQNAYYPFGSRHTFGNTYAQTTNRFKFNGKEEQTTGNLNYLDYGARMYDSNIARWTTQDPLAEKYYSQSPYNYCVNNPVMFVDPDGRFVLDKETEKQYPALANFLRNMLNEWHNKSNDFKDAFYSTSGMNEEQVISMLTYGQGPQIQVRDISQYKEKQGATEYVILTSEFGGKLYKNKEEGSIILDVNNTVSHLENAQNRNDKEAATILVESTIYHEGTHYGNLKVNKNKNGLYLESGKEFERRAYGMDIDYRKYRLYYMNNHILPKVNINRYGSIY